MSQESFNIILPIGLFIISVLISFVLHALDKHNRNLTTVKRMVDQFSDKVQSGKDSLKGEIAELEDDLAAKEARVRELLKSASDQVSELEHYSEDVALLRKTMQKYKESLGALAQLTEDADNAMALIKGDIQSLDQYKADFDTIKEETISYIKKACSDADLNADRNIENVKKECREILDGFKSSADEFVTGQIDRINRTVEDRIANLTLSAQSLINNSQMSSLQSAEKEETVQEEKPVERWVPSEMPVMSEMPVTAVTEPDAAEETQKQEETTEEKTEKKEGISTLVGSDVEDIEYDGNVEEIVFD